MFELRPYQKESVRSVIDHFRINSAPAVVVLPTGAGKSLVIAQLAKLAKGRVLVLAHVKELVEQNHEKYESYGCSADIFSAGLKRKEAERQVVFGSVQSVTRNLNRFSDGFTLLVIDECHRLTLQEDSQYQKIIKYLRINNPDLKILGLTATPYRLGFGWIYRYHYHGMVRGDEDCFFNDCIFELPLRFMIKHKYLTPPKYVNGAIAQYDFSNCKLGTGGCYQESELNHVIKSAKRATAKIISDVLEQAVSRQGVMIFAATVDHAREILGYLPQDSSALILGETKNQQRDDLIQAFKDRRLKYLVNVAVLTTGFDAPHVDLIAILRPTESVSLYQQIVGRGLRLSSGKVDCLILEYAGNHYDLFAPEIGSAQPSPDTEPVMIFCPKCNFANTFWGKKDSDGDLIEHYGRRCHGIVESQSDKLQCDYRFRFKACGACNAENDIAARRCDNCNAVIIDPDTKLREALALKNVLVLRCSGMTMTSILSKAGQPQLKVDYYDEDGAQISEYFSLNTKAQKGAFYFNFIKLHLRNTVSSFHVENTTQVVASESLFRYPDFIIAKKNKHFWEIQEKLFDYEGQFRRANQM